MEYGLDLLRDVYILLGEIQKTYFLVKMTVILR